MELLVKLFSKLLIEDIEDENRDPIAKHLRIEIKSPINFLFNFFQKLKCSHANELRRQQNN